MSVSLTTTPSMSATIGDSVDFTCTAMLSANVSGATIVFDYGFVNIMVIADAATTQTNTATTPTVIISSTGSYTCTVTVIATGECGGDSEPACPTSTSDAISLTVTCELMYHICLPFCSTYVSFNCIICMVYNTVCVKNLEGGDGAKPACVQEN